MTRLRTLHTVVLTKPNIAVYQNPPERFQRTVDFLRSNGFVHITTSCENGRDVITITSTQKYLSAKMHILNEASKLSSSFILIRGRTITMAQIAKFN